MRAKLKHAREHDGLSTLYLYTSYSTVITTWQLGCFIGTHTITTEKALLSQSPQINTYVCIISRLLVTITWCRFSRLHNQHSHLSIDFIPVITQNLTISTHQHLSPPLLTKSRRKCVIFCPKSLFLTKEQLYVIHFFLATCNVCPLAIPESCAHNIGI